MPDPKAPSPDGKGGRPQVVWDPEDDYWTLDDGGGGRTHWGPATGQQIIKATIITGAGAALVWQILEYAAAGALAF